MRQIITCVLAVLTLSASTAALGKYTESLDTREEQVAYCNGLGKATQKMVVARNEGQTKNELRQVVEQYRSIFSFELYKPFRDSLDAVYDGKNRGELELGQEARLRCGQTYGL